MNFLTDQATADSTHRLCVYVKMYHRWQHNTQGVGGHLISLELRGQVL